MEEQTRMTEGVLKSVIEIRDCRKLEASIRFIIRILQGADRDIFHDQYALVQREIKRMALVAKQLNRELLKVKRSRTPVPAM